MTHQTPRSERQIHDTLLDGVRAIGVQAVLAIPEGEGTTRLADSPYTIEFDLQAQPAVARVTIVGDDGPIAIVPAAEWPAGFGEALAGFVDHAFARRSAQEQQMATAAVQGGAQAVVVFDPAVPVFRLELRAADRRTVIGELASAPRRTH